MTGLWEILFCQSNGQKDLKKVYIMNKLEKTKVKWLKKRVMLDRFLYRYTTPIIISHAYWDVSGKAHFSLFVCLRMYLRACVCGRAMPKHVDAVRGRLFSIVEWSKKSPNSLYQPLQAQMDSNGIPWIFGERGWCFRISWISVVWQTQSL